MSISLKNFKKLPDAPGVYMFLGNKRKKLYIGKAASLKNRVRSYFREDIAVTRGPKIAKMLELARSVDFEKTDSVLEALILEAALIKKYQPPYNTDQKDDKSWNYAVITKEEFPRVLLVRQRELLEGKFDKKFIQYSFGPFTQGGNLKIALKLVRKIIPFRDSCAPESGKPCFNAQIGLCPGVCSGAITAKEYAKNIRNIKMFFEGKKKTLISKLEREMKTDAKNQEFEKAEEVKRTIFALKHIHDVALLKNEPATHAAFRIEAYDVAHTSGKNAVGVMAVVTDGVPDKKEYRTFNIKSFEGVNDTRALAEIIDRRLAHHEWKYPRLIVVDGGKAQLNAAEKALNNTGVFIPVVSVIKDERHRAKGILGDQASIRAHEKEIFLANAESHRFSLSRHRRKRDRI
ncbi:GIY-YIG nuclease family protein [bacterium]|nr:GIY-YIG nuclease family protein [bacterium]